ncbi:MAG: GxxExxY protein [Verrucomicrobia bacterium]|nr:GxxExxY protein [Verrucomicrobiota bacterium]
MYIKIDQSVYSLCDHIREISYSLHGYLKQGHLEKVYENGLANRLRKAGFIETVFQQHPMLVLDEDGTLLGDYFADLLVNQRLVIELKAVKALADEHTAQLLGYLRSSRIEHGLLINFGAPKLQIKKYALSEVT